MAVHEDPEKVIYFAETDARNKCLRFGIKTKDRSRHVYIIGKTGMGKSTLLENLAVQDIQNGHGLAFIDPHGKTADLLLDYIPEERVKDVLYFAPFDLDYPISFNVLEDVGADKRHLVANGLMAAFKKIWVDAWSARMEYILNNILLALLEYPESTIIGVNRMLADEAYRNKVIEYVTDPAVKSFWLDEFAKYGKNYMQEAGAAIQNKIGQFISNPLIRNIIGQPKSTFDIRKIMDEGKILIINLSKGRVGEANANLLGGMLITKIYLAAMSRADKRDEELKLLPNFYLFVDEFQNFANESFADILSEARKYKLNLTVAHQYIEQMTEEVRAAVFGNVGTMITFRVGAYDAEVLEKEFAPNFTAEDLVNLGFAQVYLKLMIDGVSSRPFSATTLPPVPLPPKIFHEDVVQYSRDTFARPRAEVEDAIRRWHEEQSFSVAETKRDSKKSPIDLALQAVLSGDRNHTPPKQNSGGGREFSAPRAHQGEVHREGSYSNPTKIVAHSKVTTHSVSNGPQQTQAPLGKKEAANEREKALRRAVSLSYLRQTGKLQDTKDKKAPTEEHLSGLREALAMITGTPLKDEEKREGETPKIEPAKEEVKISYEEKVHIKEKVEAPEEKIVEEKKVVEGEKSAPHKEVPEEVLRRILDIK